jgi:hypothetical protein
LLSARGNCRKRAKTDKFDKTLHSLASSSKVG